MVVLVFQSKTRALGSFVEQLLLFLMLSRPRTTIPSLVCYALGFSYSRADFSSHAVLGAFISFLGACLSNLSNTYTDLEEDSRNLPGRIYLLEKFGYQRLLWLIVIINLFMMIAAAYLGLHSFIIVLLGLFFVNQYSFPPLRTKARPITGLCFFAQAVIIPFILGGLPDSKVLLPSVFFSAIMSLFTGEVQPDEINFQSYRYLGMLIFVTLWFVAKGTFKNVPDFYGDFAAGLRTSATICGTWQNAAIVTAVATVGSYLSLIILVGLGLESPKLLLALIWLVPVFWNCFQLLCAQDGAKGNECLKVDMLISSGFIASVLLLIFPCWENAELVAVGGLVLFGSDLFRLDSRREEDVTSGS